MRATSDVEAWKQYPDQRWVFNKLEVALRFGYDAGPASIPITKPNNYIVRPIYNLFGMGAGARKKFLDPDLHNEEITTHCKHIPPGYFWCEYFEGDHYSVDYRKENGKWVPFSAMIGMHQSTTNLIRFSYWEVVNPPPYELPDFLHELETDYLNLEMKNEKIFEVHLRSGNEHVWNLPINSRLYTAWADQDTSTLEHLPFIEDCDGYLDNVRTGFYVKQP